MRLELSGVSKAYGEGLRVLDDLSLEIGAGTVCGLVGQNGTGKSTLAGILSGVVKKDSGKLLLRLGATVHDLVAARDAVGVIPQVPRFVQSLDAVENVFFGTEADRWGGLLVDRRRHRELADVLQRQLFALPTGSPHNWSPRDQSRVSFMRGIASGRRVLVIDEATSGVPRADRTIFLEAMRAYAAKGRIVVFISHDFDEVADYCDSAFALVRGKAWQVAPLTSQSITTSVFGDLRGETAKESSPFGAPVLTVQGTHLNFSVCAKEVSAVVCREPEFLHRILDTFIEPDYNAGIKVALRGDDLAGMSLRERRQRGLAIIPGHNRKLALVSELTCEENLGLNPNCFQSGWRSRRHEASLALQKFGMFKRSDTLLIQLSGGNQQKVLLAKELAGLRDGCIVALNPCTGIDQAARQTVLDSLKSAAIKGSAVLLLSTEVNDVAAIADVARSGAGNGEPWTRSKAREHLEQLFL